MNVRQYNGVNRAVKWMSDNTMGLTEEYNEYQTTQLGKQRSKMNVKQYNGVNRGVKLMSDNTMG